jgi:hypothetical protein
LKSLNSSHRESEIKFVEKDQCIVDILGNLDALSEQANVDDVV